MIFKPYLPDEQYLPWSCGPACLANAMAIMGIPISQEQAIGLCRATATRGTSVENLSGAARRCGFDPYARRLGTKKAVGKVIRWARELTKAGIVVAATINDNGTDSAKSHWILLLAVDNKYVTIWDPSNSMATKITHKNLLKALWCDAPAAKTAREYLVAFLPGSKIVRRAYVVRYGLLYPTYSPLTTKKDKD